MHTLRHHRESEAWPGFLANCWDYWDNVCPTVSQGHGKNQHNMLPQTHSIWTPAPSVSRAQGVCRQNKSSPLLIDWKISQVSPWDAQEAAADGSGLDSMAQKATQNLLWICHNYGSQPLCQRHQREPPTREKSGATNTANLGLPWAPWGVTFRIEVGWLVVGFVCFVFTLSLQPKQMLFSAFFDPAHLN